MNGAAGGASHLPHKSFTPSPVMEDSGHRTQSSFFSCSSLSVSFGCSSYLEEGGWEMVTCPGNVPCPCPQHTHPGTSPCPIHSIYRRVKVHKGLCKESPIIQNTQDPSDAHALQNSVCPTLAPLVPQSTSP